MKILVTGGCGFIGSHIVDKLVEKKYEVVVVDNLNTGKLENININKVTYYDCDITTPYFEEVVKEERPERIIHQAAQSSVPASIHNIGFDAKTNILGSVNIIEVSKKYNIEKIIFASTAAVYGNPIYYPIDTAHPKEPLSPYGLSKLTIEKYLKLAKRQYNIDYTILRYGNVFGPRQDANGEGGVIAVFIESLLKNTDIKIFGDGKQTRDFIYVEDVAEANIKAINKANNETLNISTLSEISINDLYGMLTKLIGKSKKPIYTDSRDGDIHRSILCNEKTIKKLNWTNNTPLIDGLNKTINYYKFKIKNKS